MADKQESGEKREKFVKLAENRTANAIRAIRVIGNLSNRSHYEFTDADIRKIAAALTSEVDSVRRRFTEPSGRSAISFKL
jgi:hypothetical protein